MVSSSSKDFVNTPVLACGVSTSCHHSTSCHQPPHMLPTTQHKQATTIINLISFPTMTSTMQLLLQSAQHLQLSQPNPEQHHYNLTTLQPTRRANPVALALLPSPPKHTQQSTTARFMIFHPHLNSSSISTVLWGLLSNPKASRQSKMVTSNHSLE